MADALGEESGASGGKRAPLGGFSDRPEARPAGVRLVDTGSMDASSTTKLGAELAYQAGPFSAEAEYLMADVDLDNGNGDPTFDGYHIQASYVLTGESRSYGGGGFGGITPAGPGGAWEIAARFSHLDLNDEGFRGGEQDSITLGVNYYHSANLRFMANAIFVDVDDSDAVAGLTGGASRSDSPSIFLARAQYNF